jgi:hypothetical protein
MSYLILSTKMAPAVRLTCNGLLCMAANVHFCSGWHVPQLAGTTAPRASICATDI